MLRLKLTFVLVLLISSTSFAQSYNPLWIPDTLSGTTFDLSIRDTFVQYKPGNQTITGGINEKFWGPTLIFNKGDVVHMKVRNFLNDSTTIHWHGMHLPAVMDGGPHQIIPPGTIWEPYWTVSNNAATYWYHPHLHQMTQEHITKGIGGFIIVRDSEEAALALPRSYGVDDIPLVLTSRRFDGSNAFVYQNISYGDEMLTNGVLKAEVSLPRQMVRFRILNAEIERGYMLGFSDNRTFYVIGNDGGLLNAPVAVTRLKLLVGERAEIMVDLGDDDIGKSIDMEAFNSGQAFGFPGGEPQSGGPLGSLLNNVDFPVLHITVAASTASKITSVPKTLAHNVYWTATDATVNKTVNVTDGTPGTNFTLDGKAFDFNAINKHTQLGAIEKWTITNNMVFSHAFHIHDVEFKIISRSSGAVGDYESGWKDVVALPRNESVTFVAKFDDYADAIHPYMYHCHFSNHEDGGMMGQFVVDNPASVLDKSTHSPEFTLFPNPAKNLLFAKFDDLNNSAYYGRIVAPNGRTLYMLPRPDMKNGIDISLIPTGSYFLQLTDEIGKITTTKKFIKE
ncbi:MAG: multicopper oxidase domain-containing protein [bacterium]